jgi:hypothetical protein
MPPVIRTNNVSTSTEHLIVFTNRIILCNPALITTEYTPLPCFDVCEDFAVAAGTFNSKIYTSSHCGDTNHRVRSHHFLKQAIDIFLGTNPLPRIVVSYLIFTMAVQYPCLRIVSPLDIEVFS